MQPRVKCLIVDDREENLLALSTLLRFVPLLNRAERWPMAPAGARTLPSWIT